VPNPDLIFLVIGPKSEINAVVLLLGVLAYLPHIFVDLAIDRW
jgi:hypothetical protein